MNATARLRERCENSPQQPTLALVHDAFDALQLSDGTAFPDDARAEWESEQTVRALAESWRAIGFRVETLPFDSSFSARWEQIRREVTLVHSVLEGWGSISREAWIPSLCELHGVAFIGSPAWAQSVGMSKSLTRALAREVGVKVASAAFIRSEADILAAAGRTDLFPAFLKPDAEGSGMGIDVALSLIDTAVQLRDRASALLQKYPDGLLCERRLDGPEFTVSLLGNPLRPLPVAQVEVPGGVYGLAWKGKDAMEEKVTFPALPVTFESELTEGSLRLAQRLGCLDFVRMDWRCDSAGQPYFLEANPLAGLSPYYSVLPLAAAQDGISMLELLSTLALGALERFERESRSNRSLRYARTRLNY